LHGGDFAATSVLVELEGYGPVAAVCGNADEPALKQALPKQRVVEVEGVRIGMVHIPGPRAGREARLSARFPDCAAVIYGHTHLPEVAQHEDVWILNPGSPTERRKSPVRSMLTLDVDADSVRPTLVELP
jgi:uncharacterized protein